ncbi:MAG: rRNA adenine N-6-methyltransferase family protein, partial [candidate division WOR-3 bacterium]
AWRLGVFTLQREFAQRLLAAPGSRDYGAVTVQFALDTECERLFNLPPEYFKPRPGVVSSAVRIRVRRAPLVPVRDRARFVTIVKAAFSQRRKTLANNLTAGLGIPKSELLELAQGMGIDLSRRAETLTVQEYAVLAQMLPMTEIGS